MALPQVVLGVAVELVGAFPAEVADGLADVLFVDGRYRAVAAMVFVVALTVEVADEVALQTALDAVGHVVVYLRDAEGHADGLVVTVHGTRLGLHGRIVEVDTHGEAAVFGCEFT